MTGVISPFPNREIPTRKVLAGSLQTRSLPIVIPEIARKGDPGLAV
jgi:hypothetical protein